MLAFLERLRVKKMWDRPTIFANVDPTLRAQPSTRFFQLLTESL